MTRKYTPEEQIATFWSRIDRSVGFFDCWIWSGGHRNSQGYGTTRWNGKVELCHRIAWILTQGDIPEGLCVLHRCDNPPCCNPVHLFLGTRAENNADKRAKGRERYWSPKGENAAAHKLSDKQVNEMRHLHSQGGITYRELSEMFGVCQMQAWRIVNYKEWR